MSMRRRPAIVMVAALILVLSAALICARALTPAPLPAAATPVGIGLPTVTPISQRTQSLLPVSSEQAGTASGPSPTSGALPLASLTPSLGGTGTAPVSTLLPGTATSSASTPADRASPGPAPSVPPIGASPVLIVVELQPETPTPGGQMVWISNPSTAEINLGCWALHSNATGLTVIVEPGLRVPAGGAAVLSPQEAWLGVTDQVQLLNPSGQVIDQTPQMRDDVFDDQIWFRDSSGEWKFGRQQFNLTVVQGQMSTQSPAGC